MTSAGADDKRMRLRYAGRCRLCGNALPAGTDAVYERGTRTVRCLTCAVQTADAGARVVPATADGAAHDGPHRAGADEPATPTAPPTAPPTATDAPAADTPDRQGARADPVPERVAAGDATRSLRLRAPASAVIAETLRVQAEAPPQSRMARLFGVSPLSADAASWYLGALGELEVGRLLDGFGPEWRVIHAIPIGSRGSDIDHLAIGPTGVFTINTKRHSGKVWVGSRMLLVDGQRTNHLRNAVHEAHRASKLLSAAAGRPVLVTPVVAIVGARDLRIHERPADVVVVRGARLRRSLQHRPEVLGPDEVDGLAVVAAAPATWDAEDPPVPDLIAFAALRESVASARRRKRAWALGGVLAVPAVLLTVQPVSALLTALAG